MNHLVFSEQPQYPLVFLVPMIRKDEIKKEYIDPFGIPEEDVLVLDLHYSKEKKKTPAAEIKEYVTTMLVPQLETAKAQYIVVADSEYFKVLTKSIKVEAHLGYVMDCVFGPWKVVYVPSYRSVFYDPPKVRSKIAQGMTALVNHAQDNYIAPGSNIIEFSDYPRTNEEIAHWLQKLLEMNVPLAIDIEAFDLKHHKAGIGSITFCWSKTEGIAFLVDYVPIEGATEAPFGERRENKVVRDMLRRFFEAYMQRAMYHHISYDVYVLIYQLFMDDLLDTKGLLHGMSVLLRNWDDTKLITYLATNSCAGNKLGLKEQAQEYAGNYAQEEIKDITKIRWDDLLEYNLVDGLSTWFTYEKHYDNMVADQQLEIYNTLFKPAILDIIQMQLTGLPVNIKQVSHVKGILEVIMDHSLDTIRQSRIIQEFEYQRLEDFTALKNAEWKKKRLTVAEMAEAAKTSETLRKEIDFNPNSGNQLQVLLFDRLGLPVISLTENKQPSTDRDTMEALVNHAKTTEVKDLILALLDYGSVNKILTSFIPAMEESALGPDGWHYLFGFFNLGGTVSGRLSSSEPNLQNLPANVFMKLIDAIMEKLKGVIEPFMVKGKFSLGKLIKSCFQAPPGWLFVGLDFNSLEDRISALTTKDPNKLMVYTDGYDGHCLRAYAYYGENMPDIDPKSVASINSIEVVYKDYRQESKAPTFALTYQGTFHTLMKNCGFSENKAKMIEDRFKKLYSVSIDWVQAKLDEASKKGYVTAAFGLRVRTPLLHQVIRGTRKTPYEAEAEGRTAGNALGQSWCLLNSRACVEFMSGVRNSEHRLDIKPCAHIHDAQYYLIRDNIKAVSYTNKYLVKAVEWQDHPEIYHDEVKLGGGLTIFYPTWAKEIDIENDATEAEIFATVDAALKKAA